MGAAEGVKVLIWAIRLFLLVAKMEKARKRRANPPAIARPVMIGVSLTDHLASITKDGKLTYDDSRSIG